MTHELVGSTWLHHDTGERVAIVNIANGAAKGQVVVYSPADLEMLWDYADVFFQCFYREETFHNHTRQRLLSETECRNLINAALLHFANQAGGRLDINMQALIQAAERMGGIALAISDDDRVLTITGHKST